MYRRHGWGFTVYPPHETCFLAALPDDLQRWMNRPGVALYAENAEATIALMERLLSDYTASSNPLLLRPGWTAMGI